MRNSVKLAACAVLVGLAAGAAEAATSAPPTGNASAIAFDRAAVAAENRAPAYAGTQRGYLTMRSTRAGSAPVLELSWGTGVIKPGWAAVQERLTIAQQGGVTLWIDDLLTPLCIKGSACRTNIPVDLLTNFYGVYVRFPASHAACFYVFSEIDAPYRGTGTPWWTLPAGGRFLGPPRRSGADTLIRYSFPYSKAQTALETDTLVTRTKAFHAAVLRVANGPRARAPWAFTVTADFIQLGRRPPQPQVTECAGQPAR
jgi:hypothetical protein